MNIYNTHESKIDKDREIITSLIQKNKWNDILNLLKTTHIDDINMMLINENNLFHLACIKGETEFIKELIMLKKSHKIDLNLNLFNEFGLSGAQLYYKYGGNDPFLLSDKNVCYVNDNNFVLATYLIDNIDLLKIHVNKMIELNCIENIAINDQIFVSLLNKINYYTNIDENKTNKYLKIVEKICDEIKDHQIVFIAIKLNCIDVIKMLMIQEYNFEVYSNLSMTALGACMLYDRVEICVLILEYTKLKKSDNDLFNLINTSNMQYELRPFFIANTNKNWSMIKILIQYMNDYVKNNHDMIP